MPALPASEVESYHVESTPDMVVPSETERKYSATICALNASGANLVTSDRPTGEINSSAMVKTSRIRTNHHSGEEFAASLATGRNIRNATPITALPSANLMGVIGCRSPSLVHSAANTPASTITKIGLIELTADGGISQPNRFRSSFVSAYTATTVNCCWYSDQNAALAANIGMNETTRERSSAVILAERRMTTK